MNTTEFCTPIITRTDASGNVVTGWVDVMDSPGLTLDINFNCTNKVGYTDITRFFLYEV